MALTAFVLSFGDLHANVPHVLSSASSVFSGEHDRQFSLDSGVYGVVYEGGEMTEGDGTVTVHKGSALLASEGMLSIDMGDANILTFDGALYVTQGQSAVTVAALTAPALVRIGEQRMVIPASMQWSYSADGIATLGDGFETWMADRMPSSVPSHFLERMLTELSGLTVPADPLPPARDVFVIETLSPEELLLPVSRQHLEGERRQYLIGVVRGAAEQSDVGRLRELFDHEDVSALLETAEGKQALSFVVSNADAGNTALTMTLLEPLLTDESLWMVASLHPEYRDIAWALNTPDASVEAQLARVFLLPASTLSSHSFSDFVLERYETALLSKLEKVGDAESFIEHLLSETMPLIERLEQRGYPRRAQYLTRTLVRVIEALPAKTKQIEEAYRALVARSDVSIAPLPSRRVEEIEEIEVIEEIEDSEPEVILSPEEVEGAAYTMLDAAGALFTVNTGIAATSGNEARITDILFRDDRTVTFTLDVVTGIVSDIVINGQSNFPFEPLFDGFVTWVRK